MAAAHDVPILLLASPAHFDQIARMAVSYPSVPVVVDHLGRFDLSDDPDSAVERLCDLAALPNIHAKASALSSLGNGRLQITDVWALLAKVIDAFGSDRIMWGSDYPFVLAHCPYVDGLRAVEAALGRRCTRETENILGGNALRVFFTRQVPR
jgi:L-fuconolactonase